MEKIRIAKKTTVVSIVGNIFLSIIKITIGFLGNSSAMIADGFHSVSDVITSFIAFFAVKFSAKKQDDKHQYGHEKIELVVSKILAIILFLTGGYIAYNAINIIQANNFQTPGFITIYAAILSILSKEFMYRYTIKGALKIDSKALKADAWHHRSDALSSIGALIGIVGSRMGYPILDPVFSIVIASLVIKVAVDIYIESVKGLIDTAADKELIKKIENTVLNIDGVISIDLLKSRLHGDKIYIDLEIKACGDLTLNESHDIAEKVHLNVEDEFNKVKHCMVHVNPYKGECV